MQTETADILVDFNPAIIDKNKFLEFYRVNQELIPGHMRSLELIEQYLEIYKKSPKPELYVILRLGLEALIGHCKYLGLKNEEFLKPLKEYTAAEDYTPIEILIGEIWVGLHKLKGDVLQ